MKAREFWVKATGYQTESSFEIDLTIPGEDRWINTHIQTVNPGTNSVAKSWKCLHLVDKSAYDKAISALREIMKVGTGAQGNSPEATIAYEALGQLGEI